MEKHLPLKMLFLKRIKSANAEDASREKEGKMVTKTRDKKLKPAVSLKG